MTRMRAHVTRRAAPAHLDLLLSTPFNSIHTESGVYVMCSRVEFMGGSYQVMQHIHRICPTHSDGCRVGPSKAGRDDASAQSVERGWVG
jgi:hypothetical protein